MSPVFAQTSVLIVGAGPTGLVHALWLARRGIAVRIIDQSKAPGLTSRALAVQARTLEFYRQLGIAEELLALGVIADRITLRRRARVVAVAELGAMGEGLTPYPYLVFVPQDLHEKLLISKLEALGVRVERETRLTGLLQDESRVIATLEKASGAQEQVEAQYLTGCDGAHSTVRRKLGIGFEGGTYQHVFYVADAIATGEAAGGGVQISVSPEDFCIVMPVAQTGTVRLTGIVPPEVESRDAGEPITFEDVRESVRRNTGLEVSSVRWFSTYHVHHRVASTFKQGRVFLAGDAGHIHSPAGGQGMNTGIGDAINLAWKLSDVLQGRASPALLETYEEERIAFARTLVRTTDTTFRLVASRTGGSAVFRAYVLPVIVSVFWRLRFAVRAAFRVISQTRLNYRGMRLAAAAAGASAGARYTPGERLPWTEETRAAYDALRSLDWVQVGDQWVRPDGYVAGGKPGGIR